MNGKNIIYICNYAAGYTGNFIASLAELAIPVMQKNRVFFLFPEAAQDMPWLPKLPVPMENIFFCSFEPKKLYAMCRKLANTFSPENTVVHTHFVDGKELIPVTFCFRNVIVHYHMFGPKVVGLRSFLKKVLMNLTYRNTIVVAVSEAVMQDLKKYVYFCKHTCITNAIAFKEFEQIAKRSNNCYVTDRDYFSILIHGTSLHGKGVDLAIKALESMEPAVRSKCMLYITSNNRENAQNFVSGLGSAFTNVRIQNVVEDVKNLYDSMDLFLSPSRKEAFGYAVAEASYSECQVLASDVPGQNTMKDIPGIIWVNPEDSESLKTGIEEAILNKETGRMIEMKQKQKEYVAEHYDISNWVSATMALYDTYFG